MPKKAKDIKESKELVQDSRSVTDKINQLDSEIEWFYGEDFRLDEALQRYQAASQLADEIDQDLGELRNQVELIEDFTKS